MSFSGRGALRRFSFVLSASAALLLSLPAGAPAQASPSPSARQASVQDCFLIDDFESFRTGDPPRQWKRNKGRELVPADRRVMEAGSHEATIQRGRGGSSNAFVRMQMNGYAFRLIKLSGEHFPTWNTSACPFLSWRWRVNDYPEGADESDADNNDVAAAVYVTFGRDWLGRPKSIKYTYSSTLPVGTTVSYGPLKVLVVASAADGSPVGEWMHFKRDVVRDYENLFGEAPGDATPLGIQLFSDADVSASRSAVADFDDVRVLSE